MDINITFFIQIFHFFLAYLILEKLLFRPTVATIKEEQNHYNNLLTSITAQQKILKDKEEQKQREWETIRRIFAKVIPTLAQEKIQLRTSIPKLVKSLAEPERLQLQKTLQKKLVERLSHVN